MGRIRNIVAVDAPSNLELRPPAPGTVPGCYKLAGPVVTVGELRERGAGRRMADILGTLETPVLDGSWVHLDADVRDPWVMPAVDSPDDGGLLPAELAPCCGRWSARPAARASTSRSTTPISTRTAPPAALLTDLVVAAFAEE